MQMVLPQMKEAEKAKKMEAACAGSKRFEYEKEAIVL